MIVKRSFLFAVVLLLAAAVKSQDPSPVSHYAFDAFSKGKVQKKNGQSREESLNYNILTGEMIFESGGEYLAIAYPEEIDTVYIQGRMFIPFEKEFYEVLTTAPNALLVDYNCTIVEQSNNNGYGAPFSTGPTTSVRLLTADRRAYNMKLPEEIQMKSSKNFLILKDGKYQKANSAQQLSKIFPDKKVAINDFVKKNDVDFSKNEDVANLVKQIQ